MSISLSRYGLFIIFRKWDPVNQKEPIGLVIKPIKRMLFSERNAGYRFSFRFGNLYFRTYARKEIP